MSKGQFKLTRKERKTERRRQEVELLVALDLDLVHSRVDREKVEIIAEKLAWWEHPPAIATIKQWRQKEDYQNRREELLHHEGLAEKTQYWAGTLFAEGDDAVVNGYESLVRGGPKAYGRLWLEAARDVRKMAGLHDREAGMGAGARAFLEGLGIGIGQGLKPALTLNRQDDGTVEGEFRALPE